MSSDTIYQLTQDKKLIPLLSRTPSVHTDNVKTFLTAIFKTDKFIFLSQDVIDFDKVKRGEELPPSLNLLYKFEDGQITRVSLVNADCPECRYMIEEVAIAENSVVAVMQAFRIIEQHKEGNLSGKLKEIAETLDEEDNPVLEIIRFK